jgi:ADP-ribosylglycohydrolase
LDPEHYVIVIKKIISKAGDSDTNAAIVGGLVGAVLGFKRLPLNYLFKQFKLELN